MTAVEQYKQHNMYFSRLKQSKVSVLNMKTMKLFAHTHEKLGQGFLHAW